MAKYIAKRILLMIPVLLGISFVVFTIMSLTPGDPARMILGAEADEADVQELREELGLTDPFFVRFVKWLWNALHGDLGTSYTTMQPVMDEILARFPVTLLLALGATVLKIILAIPIGVMSATHQYSWGDKISIVIALIFTSMPSFWLGLMLLLVFALQLSWLPSIGADSLKHFILPWVTTALPAAASLIRMTRSYMLEVIRSDYVRTARAKGVKEKVVIYKHAMKNAMMPLITLIGNSIGAMLGGGMIIEQVFGLPGLGFNTITAIRSKNIPLALASILFVAFLAGFVNLIVDIIYAYIDPRVKARYATKG